MTLTMSLRGDDGYEVTLEGELHPACLSSSQAMLVALMPAAADLQACFIDRLIATELADLQRGAQLPIMRPQA